MANEINQSGFGNAAFQNISDSTINYSQQIVGKSPEYAEMLDQQKQLEDYLRLIPESDPEKRSDIASKLFQLRERIESFKADVLKLAESFSRIEINTDRLRRAKEHFDKGEITEARVVFDEAMEEIGDEKRSLLAKKKEYEEGTLPQLKIKADEFLIWAQTTALNYESPTRVADASRYFKDSIECAASFDNLFEYAKFSWEHSAYRRALDLWQRALGLIQKDNDKQNKIACLGNLGVAYRSLGEYRKAIEYYEQALEIARESGDRLGEGSALGNLGNAYFSLDEYEKAIGYHEQALEILREIGARRGEGNTLGNLGIAYSSLGEYEKAIGYHEQALEISLEIGDRRGEGSDLGNLGNAYGSLGEYKKAIGYQEQVLEIAREIGNRLGEGNGLGNLGVAYNLCGEPEKACNYWQQALVVFEAIGVPQAETVRKWMEEAGCLEKGTEDGKQET